MGFGRRQELNMALFDTDRVLALDIGASKVVLAEFAAHKSGAPELVNYGIETLGIEPDSDTDPSAYIVSTIREILRDRDIKPAPVMVAISGQTVFPRYIKLPPVARDKVMSIVSYEAEQNVPFPIEEVVWDYEVIEGDEGGELNVMLVAVKKEHVTAIADCVVAAGLDPEIIDVAPMALYNVVRYNYPDLSACTMVLDVGARCSNVIFVEQGRVFSRSIPVAGNTITQEVMKEFDLPFKDAEKLKREHAFVAFGGVYAGPDNDVADRVSKIVRTVIARLHAEVNRSVNFYRSQQDGSPPALVLLTGGSSTIPHMDTFFREKLKVQVDFLNPFANVTVNRDIPNERIEKDFCRMGEVTGLALRRSLICPIEINLMPPHIVARKVFRKRQPLFALSALCLILAMLCWWAYFHRMRGSLEVQKVNTERTMSALRAASSDLGNVLAVKAEGIRKTDRLARMIGLRTRWIEILDAIHANLLDGMWLTAVTPQIEEGRLESIAISGSAFVDKVRDGTHIAQFRDALIANPCFSDETEITRLSQVRSSDYGIEFTLRIALNDSYVMP